MSQEPLELIPMERWFALQTKFKADWPRGICGYMVLEAQKLLSERSCNYGFKVYCPFGDVINGIVAFNIKKTFYEIIIQCPRSDTRQLEEALRKTKLIKWQKRIIFPFAPYHVVHCIQRVLGENIDMEVLPADTFIFDRIITFSGTEIPDDISFSFLTMEHLDLINSKWPYSYDSSPWYFRLLIKLKLGYGLFKDSNLITWVLYSESGALLHLYTIESHRRKGYAGLLVKLVGNIILGRRSPVLTYSVKGNENAFKLFKKLGFWQTHEVAWCYLNKNLCHYSVVIIYKPLWRSGLK